MTVSPLSHLGIIHRRARPFDASVRLVEPPTEIARPCREIAAALAAGRPKGSGAGRVVGFTSCYSGEGVTTIAVHTATAAAKSGVKTLLFDARFARPRIHDFFAAAPAPGLIEAIAGRDPLAESVAPLAWGDLLVVCAGGKREMPLSSVELESRLKDFFEVARREFDLTIVDLPPLADREDRDVAGRLIDGAVLVIEAERVRREAAERFASTLEKSGVPLLGAVLNKRPRRLPGWLYRHL